MSAIAFGFALPAWALAFYLWQTRPNKDELRWIIREEIGRSFTLDGRDHPKSAEHAAPQRSKTPLRNGGSVA